MTSVEDRYLAKLSALLRDDPVVSTGGPPPRFDIAAAVRRGERIHHRRVVTRTCVAAVVTAALLVGAAALIPRSHGTPKPAGVTVHVRFDERHLPPIADCTVHRLPFTDVNGNVYSAVAIDPHGRFVLGATPVQGGSGTAILDRDTGRVTVLPAGAGAARVVGAGGAAIANQPNDQPWAYRDGRLVNLATLPGHSAVTVGVNARGDVVGYLDVDTGQTAGTGSSIAVEWPADGSGAVRVLSEVPGAQASFIDDDGRIGGTVAGQPYVWDADGTGRALPVTYPGHWQGQVWDIVGDSAYGLLDSGQGTEATEIAAVWDLTTGAQRYYVLSHALFYNRLTTDGTMMADIVDASHHDFYLPGVIITRDGRTSRLPENPGDHSDAMSQMTTDGHIVVGRSDIQDSLIWTC